MPSKAKIRMNKKRRNRREIIERIEFNNEITRLRSDDQYLQAKSEGYHYFKVDKEVSK